MHAISPHLTADAARLFPLAVVYAQSLDADRNSLKPIEQYLIHKERMDAERATRAVTQYLNT